MSTFSIGEAARAGQLPATATVSSFIHTSDAARALLIAMDWEPGVWNIVADEPAPALEWAPVFAAAVDASDPVEPVTAVVPSGAETGDIGRPVSNARARRSGFVLQHPSWRDGFRTL